MAHLRRLLSDPRVVLPLLVILLAAMTGPRVFGSPLWGDEFRTWRDGIEKPLRALLLWTHNPDHSPLGHLLARCGAAIFGVEHAWALRLGSWLCGLACVPACWWMGRTLWSSGAGLLVALMFTVDPNISYQMTQARMYAPLMLSGIAAMTLAGALLVSPHRHTWRRAVLLGVALAAGIWSHSQIYAVLLALLLTELVVGVLSVRDRAHRRTAAAIGVALLVGCGLGAQGIWKIAHRHDAEVVVAVEVTDSPGGQLEDAVHKLTGKRGLTVLVTASAIGGFIVLYRRPTHRLLVVFLALVIVMGVINLLVAGRYRPVAHARYLTILQPPLWLAMATLVVELCAWRPHRATLGVASALTLAGISLFQLRRVGDTLGEHPVASPFAESARMIRAAIQPGDRFVMAPRSPYGMYTRYYGLALDGDIDDAIAQAPSARFQRGRIAKAQLDRGVIWLLCVVPPAIDRYRYRYPLEDPSQVVKLVAQSRGVEDYNPPDDLKQSKVWRAVVVRIEGERVELRDVNVARPEP